MKRLCTLLFLFIQVFPGKSQVTVYEDSHKRYRTHDISNEFNLITGAAGIYMVSYALTENGDISVDGRFSRTEGYFYSGAVLTAWSVINNRWGVLETYASRNNLLKLGLIVGSIYLDAKGDAQFDKGFKKNGKMYQAASVACALSIPMFTDTDLSDWCLFGLTYMGLRFGTFDYAYNSSYGLPMDYRGHTTHYDRSLKGVDDKLLHVGKGLITYTALVLHFKID